MTLRQQIIDKLGVKAQIDAQEEIRKTINFIKDYMVFAQRRLFWVFRADRIRHLPASSAKWLSMN